MDGNSVQMFFALIRPAFSSVLNFFRPKAARTALFARPRLAIVTLLG